MHLGKAELNASGWTCRRLTGHPSVRAKPEQETKNAGHHAFQPPVSTVLRGIVVLKCRKEDHVLHGRGWAWARVRLLPQAARWVLAGGEGAGADTLPSGHPVSC